MACKFLTGRKIRHCSAEDGLMVPSCEELETFCESTRENWCQCSVYCAKLREASIPSGWKAGDLCESAETI